MRVSLVRSRMMRAVRQFDTAPEMRVRSVLHAIGLRFRLNRRDLPGSPDIVLPKYRTVIFVHGCFWHRHAGCAKATTPRTRARFWRQKFASNLARDKRNEKLLREAGWRVEIVWECETRCPKALRRYLLEIFANRPLRRVETNTNRHKPTASGIHVTAP